MSHTVALDRSSEEILDDLLRSGRFDSASDAVREALRLLRDRKTRLAGLKRLWQEGVDSGDYQRVERVLDRLEQRYGAAVDDDD